MIGSSGGCSAGLATAGSDASQLVVAHVAGATELFRVARVKLRRP
jgi:hypothetical protein